MARPSKITEEAISFAELAASRRIHKSGIKKLLREQFGLSSRTSERVLARVRERMMERTGKEKEAHKDDAFAFYDSVIRDAAAPLRLKILAQERIDKLLGLQAVERHEHSGPGGGPIPILETDLDADQLDSVLEDYFARKKGDGPGPASAKSNG